MRLLQPLSVPPRDEAEVCTGRYPTPLDRAKPRHWNNTGSAELCSPLVAVLPGDLLAIVCPQHMLTVTSETVNDDATQNVSQLNDTRFV